MFPLLMITFNVCIKCSCQESNSWIEQLMQSSTAELYQLGQPPAFTIRTAQVVLNASVAHPAATYSVVSMCHLNLIIGVDRMCFTSRENPC